MAVIQYESDVSVRGRVLIDGGLPHQFLKADGSLDSNTYALASSVHNPVTLGTANGLSLATQQLSLGLASSSTTGALSGTDWNTFNGKFNTPTGLTTNFLPKWNGSGFGNSGIVDTNDEYYFENPKGRITFGTSSSENYIVATTTYFGSFKKLKITSNNLVFNNGSADIFSFLSNGRVLINKTDDDLTNQLQVAGTISASPAVNSNQVVVMSQINGKANADGSNVSGTWGINISGNAASASFLPTKYDGGDKPNPQAYFTEYTGLRVAMTRSAWLGAWSDTLWINGYSGADVPNMVAVHTIRNGEPRMWLSSQSNRATDYGTPYEVITDYNAASKVLRKGYDTNGGTYQLHSTNTSGSFSTRALEIREVNLSNADYITPAYAPAIGFHWGGLAQTKLMLRNDGQLAVSQNATDWGNPLIHSGNIGQQSVNYASTANSASAARYINIGTSRSITDLNLSFSDHAVRFDTFDVNAANKPISVNNANGVISFLMNHGPQYGKQIAFADNDDLYIRRLSGGTYGNWLSVVHSGNISSQSVNYANSSYNAQISTSCTGNAASASSVAWSGVSSKPADWLNSSSLIADHSNANEWKNSGFYENGGGGANWPTNGTWYNSINVRHSNPNNYHGFQVAMSYYDNNLWYRSYQGSGTFQAWQRAVGSNELDNYVGKTSGNRPGVTRLYRRDSDEPYNLQHNWTGTHWLLRGYYNDDFHAEVKVEYANSAGSAPNATNQNPSYLVTPGDGNGIKFWASDSYKISMGVGSLYQYGPVTDYSIKMQMDSGSPGRGFTWGREGNAPIAALNSTSGNFQTAGFVRSNRYYTDSNYYSLVGTDDNDSFGNPWYGIGRKNGSIVNLNGWSGINFRTNGATVAIDTVGNISTPGKMTLNSTAAGAGYWTAFVTNSRTALSSLTSGNGYGIFYYQGSSGRDGADSIDFAFNTTTSATSALSIKTNGDMKLAGAFTAGGKITAYSDKRLKTNIRDIKNPLSGILKVKGVLYDRLDNDSKDQIGFLAQDLEEIFPELVITGLDGIKSVNYQAMTAILVEAIKEQQLQIDKLKS